MCFIPWRSLGNLGCTLITYSQPLISLYSHKGILERYIVNSLSTCTGNLFGIKYVFFTKHLGNAVNSNSKTLSLFDRVSDVAEI